MKKFEELTYADMGTPRYARAMRFSQMVQGVMSEFIPGNRQCRREIERHLLRIGWENNAEIISVPPECDEFDKLRLERARYEIHARLAGVDIPGGGSDAKG